MTIRPLIPALLLLASAAHATPPTIGACPVLPADNIWNTPVDQLPLDANSATYIATIGSGTTLHADFGAGLYNGGPIGIPLVTVPGTQTKISGNLPVCGRKRRRTLRRAAECA